MDVAPVRSIALPRSRTLLVAGALLVAFAVRVALAWLHATPNYFPDEYLYAALGRSFGSFDGATIRGGGAHFPALLEPLLAAPVWHIGSVETAYRLVQVVHAAAFTLAAIPAYAIARRVGVGGKTALAVAAGALLIPDAVYAGFVLAEPIAYPLALGAIAAGIAALERPRVRTQWLFLACAALAMLARLQLAVLPLCFALAVVAIGLREHDLRRLVRAQRLPLAAAALAVLGALAGVTLRGLGYYSGASHLHFDVVSIGKNLTVLFYGAGWAIVPGAAIAIVLCIARPRARAEAAFGWLAASFGAALVLEAAIWGDSSLVQERYVFYVLPLAGAAFCVQAARGWPLARVQAVLAAGLLLLSVRVPLSGWAQPGTDDHSAFLLSVERLQLWFGTSTGDLVVAAAAALLSIGAALGPWRPRVAAPLLVGAALAASAASLAGVTALDHENSLRLMHRYLPAERSWVDAEHVGHATLLEAAGNRPSDGEEQLFWNRSLRRVAVLPGGSPPDRLAAAYLSIDPRGVLRDHGRALRGPLVVDGYASTVDFRAARIVARAPRDRLIVPAGIARLRLYVIGRSTDGLLASSRGAILFWADRPGMIVVRVSGGDLHVGDRAIKGSRLLQLPVCRAGRFAIAFQTTLDRLVGGRPAGGRMSLPRFVPGSCHG
ncbi:MAG: hypothetical protein ABI990_00850 [Actinomycetota bacterium]